VATTAKTAQIKGAWELKTRAIFANMQLYFRFVTISITLAVRRKNNG